MKNEIKKELRIKSIHLFRDKRIDKERHYNNLKKIESGEIKKVTQLK